MIKKIFFLHIVYTYKPWSYPSIAEQTRVCLGCYGKRQEEDAGLLPVFNIMKREIEKESVKFRAKAVIYANETGFKIIAGTAFDVETGARICNCSMKGQMVDVEEHDDIFAVGYWDEHPKYGVGFKIEAYVKVVPQDKKSILNYLENGNIAGISKKRAKQIVDKFGDNTFDVLVYQTHLLKDIKGIGKKSIEKIKKSAKKKLETQNMLATIMTYIQGFGVSPAYASRIFEHYGLDSIHVIKKNPYQLAEDVSGIGFLKADEIALKNGIAKDSPMRIESAIKYTLKQMNDDGHVFGYVEDVQKQCRDMLAIDITYVQKAVESLIKKKQVVCEDDALYSVPLYKAETESAKKIINLLLNNTKEISVSRKEVENFGCSLKPQIEYAKEQVDAIVAACKSNVLILTGGPGTGKTTTVNGIIKMLEKHGMKVICAAPTGKAAKRMSETTGKTAQTIHRTLEVKSEGNFGFKFGRNENSPLEGDALIIDESSMIDMGLMYSVLKAVPLGMKLILVGDVDQLPSVGCGNVLQEMIVSNLVPIVRLNLIFRQAEQSDIIKNAHLINEGEVPSFKNRKDGDYFFMDVDGMEQEQIRDCIVDYVCNKIPKYYKVAPDEVQVLAPMKKGPTGVWELNDYIQNRINPPSCNKAILPCNDHILRVGDKVMFTTNDYDKDVFNGDIGHIVSIFTADDDNDNSDSNDIDDGSTILDEELMTDDDDGEHITNGFIVDFDGKLVKFNMSRAKDFVLAYATTIHKSQGSEYDYVVMPLTNANYIMLQRNLFYTGVTRAKKVYILFGQKNAVARAVKNLKVISRNTRLAARIEDEAGIAGYATNVAC